MNYRENKKHNEEYKNCVRMEEKYSDEFQTEWRLRQKSVFIFLL